MYILSIDQGTTSTRSIVYDASTFRELGSASREIQQHYPQPGWVEHDAEVIWQSVVETVPIAISRAGINAAQIATIGITNQRETVVLWDKATGKLVANAVVWQDRRTTQQCQSNKDREEWLTEKTGLVLDPYFSATKIKWLLDSNTSIRLGARQGEILFGTVDSFLLWRLTGGKVHATDHTNASRTLLFNINTCQWDEELCDFFAIPSKMLPESRISSNRFGQTSGLSFLPDGISIGGIAGDQQAALFGQGAHQPGNAKCTYGTGAFLLIQTGEKLIPSKHRLLTTLAATITETPKYALEGSIFVAGAAVQWLRDGLNLFSKSNEIEEMAISSKEDEPVIFVPSFVGMGTPFWFPQARGAIYGITRSTSKADIARAALEGVAFQVSDLVEAATRDMNQPLESLRVDGGMSRNDWFLQKQADILNVPLLKAECGEATALGAAMLAGISAGLCDENSVLQVLGTPQRFEPRWNIDVRSEKVKRWRKAVKSTIALEQETENGH